MRVGQEARKCIAGGRGQHGGSRGGGLCDGDHGVDSVEDKKRHAPKGIVGAGWGVAAAFHSLPPCLPAAPWKDRQQVSGMTQPSAALLPRALPPPRQPPCARTRQTCRNAAASSCPNTPLSSSMTPRTAAVQLPPYHATVLLRARTAATQHQSGNQVMYGLLNTNRANWQRPLTRLLRPPGRPAAPPIAVCQCPYAHTVHAGCITRWHAVTPFTSTC